MSSYHRLGGDETCGRSSRRGRPQRKDQRPDSDLRSTSWRGQRPTPSKVIVTFDPSLLEYQREMRQSLRQVIQHQFIGGVKVRSRAEPPLAQMDLLPPPMIDMLDLDIYHGKFDDLILIAASDDFGIENLHVMIHDDQGNLIESGEAMDGNDGFGIWCYFTEVRVPSGTSVIVQAIATDCLGNVGARRAGKTIS